MRGAAVEGRRSRSRDGPPAGSSRPASRRRRAISCRRSGSRRDRAGRCRACRRARSNAGSSAAGGSCSPSTATGSPRSNSISRYSGLSGASFRGDGAAEHKLFRLDPRIFEHLPLGGDVQQIGVDRKRGLAALVLGDRDLVLLGVFEKLGARGQLPFAPRRDDLDIGIERIIAELETDLVVALAGRAVSDGVGRRPGGRSRSAVWRSAAAQSRCREDRRLRRAHWRETSERRNRGRIPRADRRRRSRGRRAFRPSGAPAPTPPPGRDRR